ncbi:MAG: hypothetical protein GF364_21290 [Candidatus Lokiarchaeota archaeon]|nr:hypothetical protein [Candidatus Lokiarchaeota archaeon]
MFYFNSNTYEEKRESDERILNLLVFYADIFEHTGLEELSEKWGKIAENFYKSRY